MIRTFSLRSAAALAIVAVLATAPAVAQPTSADTAPIQRDEGDITTSQDIVVLGSVGYRGRSDEAEPVLSYDSEFFQRFEPLTAGDALKRVPSVTFLSDVIESDGARLRGLPPGYTQILINGERVPGNGDDRSFFMDRIPAELIDRVEILRSSSARRTGDAVAGTINIELRDGFELDGGYVRAGALYFDDEELEPSLGLVYGGKVGPGRLLVGLNFQGRHNPKRKRSLRYGDSPENDPDFRVNEFDNREDQSDTRDGKDYSANASYEIDGETTGFRISGFYVRTDRTETERSFEYDDPTAISGPLPSGNLLTDNRNVNNIDQENYSIDARLSHDWSLGKTTLRLGHARFDDKQRESENEIDFDVDYDDGEVPVFEQAFTATDIVDKEYTAKLDHEFDLGHDIQLVVGGFYQKKKRNTAILDADGEEDFPGLETSYDQFADSPDDLLSPFDPLEPTDGGVSRIEERRLDGFALVQGKSGGLTWEAGIRYETTRFDITDFTEAAAIPTQRNEYEKWLPSASVKFDLTSRDRITASVARTNRRPDFNFISPALLEEEVGDSDLLGNPQLGPETAWGFDLGYERRIGRTGIVGINAFYRDVTDLIELTNTGEEGSEGEGTFVYQPQNVGDGKVWGVEFDLSTDLGFLGLPDTGLFGNVSWLDSEITDFAGKRRFNGQSDYVYNIGFVQDIPRWGVAFGATHRKQGAAYDRVISEEVRTTYGADLEIFVEKRIGSNFTIRAVGSNLLNGAKREVFNKFDNLEDQQTRDFDEYELESEKAGPVFQLMARYAF
ncbi:TonB-dependent receptor plug domain-containing protein [Sphingopyxis alaskensis]|jgi:iron complex outermembrane recepter protein|uniref:TonB-dependent receptor n=1 Tax=Sphingopyxis alaskensis (strain DSM 13593 / LMG 18877 / RB2256) TaxID=317655 RepID=Q1GNE4_SPHAL|nr:TonB-dependent receptor [Sphingopyxis alaskensis]ABF54828.1 TonB-dependent receptor [Sphingopyxis alaskensis RB2256]MCM3421159.1 TonB-dependent receptor [Sphingopyxis alaskensis]